MSVTFKQAFSPQEGLTAPVEGPWSFSARFESGEPDLVSQLRASAYPAK